MHVMKRNSIIKESMTERNRNSYSDRWKNDGQFLQGLDLVW